MATVSSEDVNMKRLSTLLCDAKSFVMTQHISRDLLFRLAVTEMSSPMEVLSGQGEAHSLLSYVGDGLNCPAVPNFHYFLPPKNLNIVK